MLNPWVIEVANKIKLGTETRIGILDQDSGEVRSMDLDVNILNDLITIFHLLDDYKSYERGDVLSQKLTKGEESLAKSILVYLSVEE